MINKFLIALLFLVPAVSPVFAQYPCGTDDQYHRLVQQYPQIKEFEKQLNDGLKDRFAMRTTGVVDTGIYDVPVVVHVIHDYENDYVADNTIFNAVAHWAAVFLKENSDTINVIPPYKQYVGNPRIRLHLATIDPNGKPTKGIVRTQSYLSLSADDQAKYNPWPNNQYLNIWLIGSFTSSFSSAAAYAYYPSSAAAMPYYDGVICRYDYLDVQKTIPHEIGHALNLQHTWGSTNNPGVACGDDGVDDTPPTLGHSPGCSAASVYDVTCAGGYAVTYTSSSGIADSVVDYPDTVNAQNIMDYTYCELMFTKGQAVRMRAALTSPVAGRNNLYSPANLAATGALAPRPELKPIADFTLRGAAGTGSVTDKRTYFLSLGNPGSFWFANMSWNDTITDVQWNFSNGAAIPSSTEMYYVMNKFSVPGWVTVSLTANSNAGSDTLINTHAVYVADTVPAGGVGYTQLFSGAASIANWPMFNYYNNQFKWELFSGAGYNDNSCIRYRSYDTSGRIFGTPVGDYDDVFTPAFDLTGTTDNLYLNFYTSGAYASGPGGWTPSVNDVLEVDASTTGGIRWYKIDEFTGSDLANNGFLGTEFTPTAPAQWVPRSVSVPAAYRTRNTYFRFRYRPGNTGNNLYLDNFYIYPYPTGVKEAMAANSEFNIYPNPSSGDCNIVFKTGTSGIVSYSVKDLAGKTVYEVARTFAPGVVQHQLIPRAAIPAAGMYFVNVLIDGNSATQKLVVY